MAVALKYLAVNVPGFIFLEPRVALELSRTNKMNGEIMPAGLSLFTNFHVLISVIALISGAIVVFGFLKQKNCTCSTRVYLVSAILTSVTGFFFPVTHFLPSHGVGILSLIILAFALLARYKFHLVGSWQKIYAWSVVWSLYFLFFVFIFQAFEKAPALQALAPTRTEAPFKVAQTVTLIIFLILSIASGKRFKSDT